MRRAYLLHLLTFICSYALFVGYFFHQPKGTQPILTTASGVVSKNQHVTSVTDMAVRPFSMIHKNDDATQASSSALTQSLSLASPPPTDTPSEAIMPDYSSPRALLSSLENAVRNDDLAQNRMSAVESLKLLAASGDPEGHIREALRAASVDGDQTVANRARLALTEVDVMITSRQ